MLVFFDVTAVVGVPAKLAEAAWVVFVDRAAVNWNKVSATGTVFQAAICFESAAKISCEVRIAKASSVIFVPIKPAALVDCEVCSASTLR